ncbi:MAG: hypothetical protein EAX96_21145 [Candidatus Lokiarchaeota archaeon]|nr:hypothetical protein [Candidatus Lokiarchaeota archaeon]
MGIILNWIDNWDTNLAINIIILVIIIMIQVLINKKYKKKTKPFDIISLQIIFPAGIITAIQVIVFSPIGLAFQGIAIFILVLIFNYTELWYRDHFDLKGEKHFTLNFRGVKPDSADVNVYESHYLQDSLVSDILSKNIDTLLRMIDESDFLLDIMEEYLRINPKDKKILADYKKHLAEFENIDVQTDPDLAAEAEAKQKQTVIEIFKSAYGNVHFHVLYFSWMFYIEMVEDWDIKDDIQVLIISPKEKLPDTLSLNCSVLIEEEKIYGKKFTTLFAIHGERNEDYIRITDNFVNYLSIFTLFPQFADAETETLKAQFYKDKTERTLRLFEKLSKDSSTIEQRIEDSLPSEKKRRNREDYYE